MVNKLARLIFYLTCVLMVMPLLQGTVSFFHVINSSGEEIKIYRGKFFEDKTFLFSQSRSVLEENMFFDHSNDFSSSLWITTKLGWFQLSFHERQETYWIQCADFCDKLSVMGSTIWRYKYPLGSVINASIYITEAGWIELLNQGCSGYLAQL